MAEENAGDQRKPRSGGAARQARYMARLKAERAELARLRAEQSAPAAGMPDPMAERPETGRAGTERARDVLGYTFPIDRRRGDQRFTNGLLNEVAGVLERRGYPELRAGRDMFRLMTKLYEFLYRREI